MELIIPAFIAGLLTFLAPCTLPLVPGYLGFISGVSADGLKDPTRTKGVRPRIFLNGLLYVIGFSAVFILMGSVFSLGGLAFSQYRIWLARIGGIFVIFFGLYLTGLFKLPFFNLLSQERQFRIKGLTPGKPLSSLIFGSAFAFGWTPCVGPILGSILLLASTTQTVGQGAVLLAIFSAGLAIPFLAIALGVSRASAYIGKIAPYLNVVSVIGGLFLIFIGVLLFMNRMTLLIAWGYRIFRFIEYDRLLDYL